MVSVWGRGQMQSGSCCRLPASCEKEPPFNHLVTHAFQVVNNEPNVSKASPLFIVSGGNLKLSSFQFRVMGISKMGPQRMGKLAGFGAVWIDLFLIVPLFLVWREDGRQEIVRKIIGNLHFSHNCIPITF
ncbi:MAG: hypothetical protein Ct9H300mP21_00660 [Pseudomonadota bacterium]|nr:MAG: hypothetical protein Ct9H300mP21_00660 [Pseudomonadota bacterium]